MLSRNGISDRKILRPSSGKHGKTVESFGFMVNVKEPYKTSKCQFLNPASKIVLIFLEVNLMSQLLLKFAGKLHTLAILIVVFVFAMIYWFPFAQQFFWGHRIFVTTLNSAKNKFTSTERVTAKGVGPSFWGIGVTSCWCFLTPWYKMFRLASTRWWWYIDKYVG